MRCWAQDSILKEEPRGLIDGIGMSERIFKGDSQVVGLSNWKDRIAIH